MDKLGIYAMRICNAKKKETAIISPQYITVDKNSMTFSGVFPGPIEDVFYSENPKFLEIYMRIKPDTIQYGVPTSERINVNQGLALALRIPMEFIPDPRTIIEDQHDLEKEEKER